MSRSIRVGMGLNSFDGSLQQVLAGAELAQQLGFKDVWLADRGSPDALTAAAILAERFLTLRIATAVTPVYTRTPAVLAATAQTIQQLAPRRFILGLGSSSPTMMEKWHGQTFERPFTRVKETLEVIRTIQQGEKTDFDGETLHSHGYRQMSAGLPTPIYLAALRPRMLELAATKADGIIINMVPHSALPKIFDCIQTARAITPPVASELDLVGHLQAVVTDDTGPWLDALRYYLAPYFAQTVYNRFLSWCGYEDIARDVATLWHNHEHDAARGAIPDELLHEIAVVGDQAYCQERVRSYIAQGVTCPIINCLSPDAKDQYKTHAAFCPARFHVSSETKSDAA